MADMAGMEFGSKVELGCGATISYER